MQEPGGTVSFEAYGMYEYDQRRSGSKTRHSLHRWLPYHARPMSLKLNTHYEVVVKRRRIGGVGWTGKETLHTLTRQSADEGTYSGQHWSRPNGGTIDHGLISTKNNFRACLIPWTKN